MSLFTISGELISFLDFSQFVPPLNFVKIQAFMSEDATTSSFLLCPPTRGHGEGKKRQLALLNLISDV